MATKIFRLIVRPHVGEVGWLYNVSKGHNQSTWVSKGELLTRCWRFWA